MISTLRRNPPATFALFEGGFRPFFLGAGIWSAAAIAIWIDVLVEGGRIPSRFSAFDWHVHEMLFGFVMAAVAGFLLTAIPNWTGRLPVRGPALGWLAASWLLGRIACLTSASWPSDAAVAADLLFPATLIAVVGIEIVSGRNWRNLSMLLPLCVLGGANLLMHLESLGVGVPAGLGWRLALCAILILVSVIGGRIIPSFTRNWLVQRGETRLPVSKNALDGVALGTLHLGLLAWAVAPGFWPVGPVLSLAALLNLIRLSRWRGLATREEPLLFILHVGYGWLAIGAGLLGASMLDAAVPLGAAIHAITAGTFGTMILAVMTRVTRGHTGRPLTADRMTKAIYVAVNLAAMLRVVAALAPGVSIECLIASAALWIAAFALFVAAYGGMLIAPRARPVR